MVLPTMNLADAWVGGFGLQRQGADFTERERLLFQLARVHILQALQNAMLLGALVRSSGLTGAVLVLGEGGEVLLESPEARRLLERYLGHASGSALPEPVASWVEAQRSALAQEPSAGPRGPHRVARGAEELVVRYIPDGAPSSALLLLESVGLEPRSPLTAREEEVLRWIAEGKSNGEIATILGARMNTVRNHVASILKKLGVENRTAAAAWRLSRSVTSP